MNQKGTIKIVFGMALAFLTPLSLFVKPTTGWDVIRDLALVVWWAFLIWLLGNGLKEWKPTNSK